METIAAICLGITLSAACGFRIFVPPLVMSIASIYGNLDLASGMEWIGTYPALIVLSVATIAEIAAYFIPVVDNLLDSIEIPTAIAIGTFLTSAVLGDLDPVLQWTIAVAAGGSVAGTIGGLTSLTRLGSTGLTGGLGNPLISTTEVLSSSILSILAVTIPLFAIFIVLVLSILAVRRIVRYFRVKTNH